MSHCSELGAGLVQQRSVLVAWAQPYKSVEVDLERLCRVDAGVGSCRRRNAQHSAASKLSGPRRVFLDAQPWIRLTAPGFDSGFDRRSLVRAIDDGRIEVVGSRELLGEVMSDRDSSRVELFRRHGGSQWWVSRCSPVKRR